MRKLLVVLMASLVLILAACGGNDSNSDTDTVIVGGKNFTEQLILTHIIANYLEEHTDLNIVNKAGVGATDVTHTAIINDEIDLYVEYTGTGYMSALKLEMDPVNPEDADTIYERTQEGYNEEFDITWLKPFEFENRFSLAMRGEHAEELGVTSQSDISELSREFIIGGNASFFEREDGLEPMNDLYDYEWKSSDMMDEGLMYDALRNEDVDVIAAFTTDGRIPAFNLVILEDDKNFFPPYFAAPIIRNEILDANPELADLLNELSPYLTQETMSELNAKVDLEEQREDKVAKEFLIENGLIDG